jgi:hypothetical protein
LFNDELDCVSELVSVFAFQAECEFFFGEVLTHLLRLLSILNLNAHALLAGFHDSEELSIVLGDLFDSEDVLLSILLLLSGFSLLRRQEV